jgi:hypothetical protein
VKWKLEKVFRRTAVGNNCRKTASHDRSSKNKIIDRAKNGNI